MGGAPRLRCALAGSYEVPRRSHMWIVAGATVSYHDPHVPSVPQTRDHPGLQGARSIELCKQSVIRYRHWPTHIPALARGREHNHVAPLSSAAVSACLRCSSYMEQEQFRCGSAHYRPRGNLGGHRVGVRGYAVRNHRHQGISAQQEGVVPSGTSLTPAA
eukprot:scaffold7387_cov408-Prasinococcus_capsulatus_cf.AAC.12